MTRTVEDMGAELSRRSGRRPRRSGFTLIELLIANGILILVVGAGILAFVRGQSVLSDNVHQTELDDSLTIALSQITTELRHAARNTLSLLPGTEAQTLTFQPVLGWDAVAQSRR
ncbi:MAG: PilW family protein, partial [Planctomycetota bacterium]